jgi:hypothetical protein
MSQPKGIIKVFKKMYFSNTYLFIILKYRKKVFRYYLNNFLFTHLRIRYHFPRHNNKLTTVSDLIILISEI